MTDAADARFMALAIALGARGLGQVWPNPAVGCVLVRDGRIVGRGRTATGGRPHAETVALNQAGAFARGATAYVSLEPCSHIGQTPPCCDALIAAGVSRVVTALTDPDPRVAGRGHARLRAAGIDVTEGIGATEATQVQAGFLSRVKCGRPHLTLKLATSVDGRIATATGESQWITGPAARHAVHGLRANADAVLVGAGTARADNPRLTVRGYGTRRQPVRVVASRRLDLPEDSALALTAKETPVWLCHGVDALPDRKSVWQGLGAHLLEVSTGAGRQLDPTAVLTSLGNAGLTRVFCEGGGAFAAALLSAGLVDELITFTAGLGLGAEGQPGLGAMGLDRLADAPRFTLTDLQAIGPDVMATWRPCTTGNPAMPGP